MCDDLANFVTGRERDQSRVQQTGLRQQRIHHKRCEKKTKKIIFKSSLHLSDEMISVITDCDHFSGDKVRLPGIKLVL